MIQFNQNAFENLKSVLGIKTDLDLLEFLHGIGITTTIQNFRHWKKEGTMSIDTIFSICNTLHYPIAYFFTCGNGVANKEYAQVSAAEWKEIYFQPKALITALKDNTTYAERRFELGIGRKYKSFLAGDTKTLIKMPLKKLLEIVNNASVYLGEVIIDDNAIIPYDSYIRPNSELSAKRMYLNEHELNTAIEDELNKALAENIFLRNENETLQKNLGESTSVINRKNKELNEKNCRIADMSKGFLEIQKKYKYVKEKLKQERRKNYKHDLYIKNTKNGNQN